MNNTAGIKRADNQVFGIKVPASTLEFLQSLVIAICIAVVLYLFIVTPNQIQGNSMIPNFYEGDIILTNKLSNWLGDTEFGKSIGLNYKRGDVIVYQKPGLSDHVKRIIAVPGDRVAVRDGFVYINNKKLVEEYLPPATFTRGATFIEEEGESKVVPEGTFFVMGDNRNDSLDSRYNEIGFVDKNWVKGKVILIYWPINRFGIVNTGEFQEL